MIWDEASAGTKLHDAIAGGSIDFVLFRPELLGGGYYALDKVLRDARMKKQNVTIVYDEVHFVAQWTGGEEAFRAEFNSLRLMRHYLGPRIRVFAMTASATLDIFETVWASLELGSRPFHGFNYGIERPNLKLAIRPYLYPRNTWEDVFFVLDFVKDWYPSSLLDVSKRRRALIVVPNRGDVESLRETLRQHLPQSQHNMIVSLDGSRSAHAKQLFLDAFDSQMAIAVTTSAGGTGVDTKGVSHVVVIDPPKGLDKLSSAYQFAGRAGRDGVMPAICVFVVQMRYLTNATLARHQAYWGKERKQPKFATSTRTRRGAPTPSQPAGFTQPFAVPQTSTPLPAGGLSDTQTALRNVDLAWFDFLNLGTCLYDRLRDHLSLRVRWSHPPFETLWTDAPLNKDQSRGLCCTSCNPELFSLTTNSMPPHISVLPRRSAAGRHLVDLPPLPAPADRLIVDAQAGRSLCELLKEWREEYHSKCGFSWISPDAWFTNKYIAAVVKEAKKGRMSRRDNKESMVAAATWKVVLGLDYGDLVWESFAGVVEEWRRKLVSGEEEGRRELASIIRPPLTSMGRLLQCVIQVVVVCLMLTAGVPRISSQQSQHPESHLPPVSTLDFFMDWDSLQYDTNR